jgi:hypothetical protein
LFEQIKSAAQVLPAIRDPLLLETAAADRCMLCSAVSKNLPVEIFRALETSCDDCQSFNDNFQSICENDQIELVRQFLEHERCDPSRLKFDRADDVPRATRDLLFADGRLNAETKQQFVEDKVREMLSETGETLRNACDPTLDDHANLKWACASGHVDLLKLLLQDKRVHPEKYAKELIDCAVDAEETEILDILLRDPRINEQAGEVNENTARIAMMLLHPKK